jgi:hypothetical protein
MVMNAQTIEKQHSLCKSVDELIEKLTMCSKILSENHIKLSHDLNTTFSKIGNEINLLETNLTTKVDTESSKINFNCAKIDNKIDITSTNLRNDHGKISNKIYLAFVAMGGLIISIIGLAISFADKYHALYTLFKSHIGG